VTGITGTEIKTVEFEGVLERKLVPDLVQCNCVFADQRQEPTMKRWLGTTRMTGEAEIRLYDDGWRVTALTIKVQTPDGQWAMYRG
jgi:hypothetical protein